MKNISLDAFYELSKKLIDNSLEIETKFISCLRKLGPIEVKKYYDYIRNNDLSRPTCQPFVCNRNFLLDSIQFTNNNINNNFNHHNANYNDNNHTHNDWSRRYQYYIGKPDENFQIHFISDEQSLYNMIHVHLPVCFYLVFRIFF